MSIHQSPIAELTSIHFQELQQSGLSEDTIRKAGITSEWDPMKVAITLGRSTFPKAQCPVLVFPYHRIDGSLIYHRVKPEYGNSKAHGNKKRPKYLSPMGSSPEIFFPRICDWPRIVSDPAIELVITEGEKKSLAIQQAGFHCLALAGVDCFCVPGKMRLIPSLESIKWSNRKVFIVFDSDRIDKPNIRLAESKLAKLLTDLGAIVRVVQIPQHANGPKMGADDFLVANGAAEFQKILRDAIEPEPLDQGEYKESACHIEPASEVAAMLEGDQLDGLPRLRFWEDGFYHWANGKYRNVSKSEIRCRVIKHLNQHYYKLAATTTNNVVDQLKAQALLAGQHEFPCWLPAPNRATKQPSWEACDIMPCRNGLLHLPSYVNADPNAFLPATPRFFTMTALDYDFNPVAARPARWLRFLDETWQNDPDSIQLLQEWFGYCLTADTSQQKIMLMIGPPRSGKSLITKALTSIVGTENVCSPTLASLAGPFGLWSLLNKTVAMIPDARISSRSDLAAVAGTLLSISGEDAVNVERKGLQANSQVRLKVRLMITSNELPRLNDASTALLNRMLMLETSVSHLGKEDHGLERQIIAEHQGILLWAIEGWKRLRNRGRFVEPASSAALREQFLEITSPITTFATERLMFAPECTAETNDLYKEWCQWCEETGQHPGRDSTFFQQLRAAFPKIRKRQARAGAHRYRCYDGVGILSKSQEF